MTAPIAIARPAPLPEARVRLGTSDLSVSPVCLGTMTFGEQVDEAGAFAILDRAVERGLNFLDTAEMYSVPARRETYGATETIIGRWFDARPGLRQRVVLATKVAGPSRNMDWIRDGAGDLTPTHIREACDASLRRLRTDVIDLYQIHWPNRNAPIFGGLYFDPSKDRLQLVVGVEGGVATVQNPYALNSRALDNGLDEAMHRLQVGLLAYSPLGFGALTGKYDDAGIDPATGADAATGRLSRFESMRKQRWSRPEALAAARRYNALARAHGLTPTRLALAFCYRSWRVASTIIGATSVAQLDETLDAWDTPLTPDLSEAIDAIRWELRDPAQ